MQELTLTTPSLLFSAVSLILVGIYEPVHFVCKPRTHIERETPTNTRPERHRPDIQSKETVIPDTFHADIRVAQPALLCDLNVLHLYLMANHSRLDIRDGIGTSGGFFMRMYLGNKYFR